MILAGVQPLLVASRLMGLAPVRLTAKSRKPAAAGDLIVGVTAVTGVVQPSRAWRLYSWAVCALMAAGMVTSLYLSAPAGPSAATAPGPTAKGALSPAAPNATLAIPHLLKYARSCIADIAALQLHVLSQVKIHSTTEVLNQLLAADRSFLVPRWKGCLLVGAQLLGLLALLAGNVWGMVSKDPRNLALLGHIPAVAVLILLGLQFMNQVYLLRLLMQAMNDRLTTMLKRPSRTLQTISPVVLRENPYLCEGPNPIPATSSSAWRKTVPEFARVTRTLHHDLNQVMLENVRSIRAQHRELRKTFTDLNSTYGLQMLLVLLVTFTASTITLYLLFTAGGGEGEGDGGFTLFRAGCSLALQYAILAVCDSVKVESVRTAEVIQRILIKQDLPPMVRDEIVEFSLQLLHLNMRFSAFGFFPLDFTILQGVCGTVATYLVIMIQFSPSFKSARSNTSNTTGNASAN